MSVYTTLISNIDKTAYTSVWDMDKIIGTASGTFVSTAPTAVSSPVSTIDLSFTTFGDSYYFQGIYSIDNGASWNDFNCQVPDLTTPGMPVLQTFIVSGIVGSAGTMNIVAFNYYDYVHSTGTAKTVKWKVIYFSKNRQGSLTPQNIADSTLFTSVDRNYQKVAIKEEVPFNLVSSSGKSLTVAHNLGYIPSVRAFYHQTSPSNRIDSLWGGYSIDTRITETDLTFILDAASSVSTVNGNIEYKLYYDQ